MSVQIHCLLFLLLHCFSCKAEHPCLNRVCSDEPKWLLLKAAFLYMYDDLEKSYCHSAIFMPTEQYIVTKAPVRRLHCFLQPNILLL